MAKPIKPSEVGDRRIEAIPDQCIDSFDDLIVENWNGREASSYRRALAA